LAALLPCYWIYWEVGKQLLERGSPDALYRRWIATYGGEEYAAIVQAALALTDRVGENLSTSERHSMLGNLQATPRYEWMFWDMGPIARSSGRSSQHGAASASVASDRPSWSAPAHLRACQCVPVWPSCFVRVLPFKPPRRRLRGTGLQPAARRLEAEVAGDLLELPPARDEQQLRPKRACSLPHPQQTEV
jgi:hypothetical protein